jgi:DNA polymerase-3 subunit alpha
MAAVLSSDMDRTEKVIMLLDDCQAQKLHVTPPDINQSDYFFKVLDDKHLMYGLGAIKGVGEAAIESIVVERTQHGAFKDLFDFCQRVDLRKVNRRVLEALIKSGSFDTLGKHRATLIASLNNALQQAEQSSQNMATGQHDLLGMIPTTQVHQYVETKKWREEEQLQGEKETLGFYLTGHPLNRYLNELSHFTTCRIAELNPSEHKNARIAGIITNVRTRQTKRGDRIGIFTLDDGTSSIEGVCFSEPFHKFRQLLVEDQMVIIEGEISIDDFSNSPRIVARDLATMDQARAKFAKGLQISLPGLSALNPEQLQQLLNAHRGGNCPVVLRHAEGDVQTNIKLGKNWLLQPTEALLTLLRQQLSNAEVEFLYT